MRDSRPLALGASAPLPFAAERMLLLLALLPLLVGLWRSVESRASDPLLTSSLLLLVALRVARKPRHGA